MQDDIHISLHKGRLLLMLAGAGMFSAIGVGFVVFAFAALPSLPHIIIAAFMGILGLVTVGFFGWCGIAMLPKLISRKPGLILNACGFWDHSSGISAGFIPWETVRTIESARVERQRFVVVIVSNPREIIARQGWTARFWMGINYRTYGTPIWISAVGLKISFDDLHDLFVTTYDEYRAQWEKSTSVTE